MNDSFWILASLFAIIIPINCVNEYSNWAFHFPKGSAMGLFIALAVPIEDPNENVFVAYNVEANYLLPNNESEIVEYPPLVDDAEERKINERKIDRFKIYKAIETKFKTYDYPGRGCLLRIICEMSLSYFTHNGVLGDIMHVLFTPSTSTNLGLPSDYLNAEEYGKNQKNCRKYEKKCKTNIIDIITWLDKI